MRPARTPPTVHSQPAGRKVGKRLHHVPSVPRPDTKGGDSRPATPTERDLVDIVKQLTLRDSQTIQPANNYPSVIKIFATLQEPDYQNPWQMV